MAYIIYIKNVYIYNQNMYILYIHIMCMTHLGKGPRCGEHVIATRLIMMNLTFRLICD